jgi:F0F1-type ATP synthase assembly protein I
MTDSNNQRNTSNKNLLIQYAALGSQLLAGLIIAVFLGKWIDEKLHFTFPVFIWLLPLIVIIGMILKAVKDTSKKKNE